MKIPHLTKFVLLFFFAGLASPTFAQIDMAHLEAMKARSVGPAGMSGRVTAIDAVVDNPDLFYIGTASGGLWKSENGGVNFEPLFDTQQVHSIGDISIYQKNPDIIYVGTGEGNPRNSHNAGNGMYKTIDGGHTWTHIGLEDSRNIHRVIVHPENPDVVYAGVQGSAWAESSTRGVYKSTDGGQTWSQILYIDENTGIGDLIMDPANPEKLMAAMWEFRRLPWFFTSGGSSSGLHVTFDGGATWTERTSKDGLPDGDLGRLGLGIAPSNPKIVYALVEAKKNALYRSEDGGFTFTMVNNKDQVSNRPFYYNDVFVDPANENRVYHVASIVQVSDDGGRNFKRIMNDVHPDHHAWWIDPNNPHLIYSGNDGGLAISRDRGATWRFPENLPIGQFYHVRVDNSIPYRICGGMQDNGSWCGPSEVWRAGGIRNSYWEEVAFGDGFDVMIHPEDLNTGYAMWQGGNLQRFELVTGYQKYIKPIHPDGVTLRFNWDAALAQDPFDGNTIYYGSQFVHKSTDRGDTWTTISPDLTTNDPEKQRQLESGGLTYDVTQAENYTTLTAISASPIDNEVLWAGSDDGQVHVTRDGGESWDNVADRFPDLAEGSWVAQVHASAYDAGEAVVVFDDHRRNNWEPYVYRTTNYGRNWERLTDSDDVWGYALSFAQDPIEPNLLFVGTEFHVYVSIDGGASWNPFTHGLPTTSMMDMVIHPRDHDLVVGTFGRSMYVIDDIRPLRALAQNSAAVMDNPLTAFDSPDAYLSNWRQATGTRFMADGMYAGDNTSRGAMISYWINPGEEADSSSNKKDEVTIEILDEAGTVIRNLKGSAKAGLNRTNWTLTRKGIEFSTNPFEKSESQNDAEPSGARVLPGTYTARITFNDASAETAIRVHMDPRIEVNESNLVARNTMYERWESNSNVASKAVRQMQDAFETLDLVSSRMKGHEGAQVDSLRSMTKDVKKNLTQLGEQFAGKQVQGILRDPASVMSRLFTARSYIVSGFNAPDESTRIAMEQSIEQLNQVLEEVNAFFSTDWAAFEEAVEEADISLFGKKEQFKLD